VAVHLGHLDVEQDEVDRLRVGCAKDVEGQPAVLSLDRSMAEVLEQTHEQASIERGVVDDQDAAAHADAPSPEGVAIRDACRASGAMGLAM
jgi:hypothetical protein